MCGLPNLLPLIGSREVYQIANFLDQNTGVDRSFVRSVEALAGSLDSERIQVDRKAIVAALGRMEVDSGAIRHSDFLALIKGTNE